MWLWTAWNSVFSEKYLNCWKLNQKRNTLYPFLLFCSSLHYAASLSGEADILELLLRYDANVDALNDDGETPLFFATKSNNKFAASTLIDRKANYRHKNNMGRWYWDHWWGANWQNIVFLYIYIYLSKVLRQKHVLYVNVICIFHSH